MRHRSRSIAAIGAVAALGLGTTALLSSPASADSLKNKALGLSTSGTALAIYDLGNAKTVKKLGTITGLTGSDSKLVGIDFREKNRAFYGVGNGGGIYTLSTKTAAATKVSQLSVALAGTEFGVDFNPAADRLRIVSDTGQNLRHDVNAAAPTTANDTALTNPAVAPATVGTPATGVTAAAYTNADNQAASGTVLYVIDTTNDRLSIQAPANNGTLGPVGSLGNSVNAIAGFDILSKINSKGVTTSNVGYAVLRSSATAKPNLYKVDLTSGRVTRTGDFGRGVADIAVTQPVSKS